jgi:aryl-phospho-beta-D-glucosidase BglC (GH1 family)
MSISRRQVLAVLGGAAGVANAVDALPFLRAKGKDIVTRDGKVLRLRGINLGNWLEPEGYMFLFEHGPKWPREIEEFACELLGPAEAADFWKKFRRMYITEADIAFIGRCGFNSVRIPLHWKFFVEGGDGFGLLDHIVQSCRNERLWVILDMHCAPGGQTGTNIDDSYGWPWLFESERSQQQLLNV